MAAAPAKSKQNVSRVTRSKRVQDETQQRNGHDASTKNKVASQAQSAEDLMEIENIPPAAFNTPTSTRFKDVFGIKVPNTPKHRIRVGVPSTPKSSHRSQSAQRSQSVFSAARQLFTQSSNIKKLVGRDGERHQIRQFISRAIETQTGGCTYVSGPPGTGKSALVQEVFHDFKSNDSVEISIINCVSLRTANDVYCKLLQDFSPNTSTGRSNLKQSLTNLFLKQSTSKLRLILLDEIDSLLDTDCEVLYAIFEWAMHKSSSIILVGIANALDLTDRFLPRLKARGLQPNLLPFLPYTASQISTIISNKLRSLLEDGTATSTDFVPLMQPAAIQLCAKKIASQTGDLRKAFSLVRRIIDQVEKETLSKGSVSSPSKKPLGEVSNVGGLPSPPNSSPLKYQSDTPVSLTAETAPRATIAHAAKMASGIFNNGTLSRLSGLNLQQKAVLCSLVGGEKRKLERNPFVTPSKSSNKIPTVKDLFVKYSLLCKRDEGLLQALKDTEFRDVVASLETLGLVHEQRGRTSSLLTPTSTPSRAGRNNDDRHIVSAVSEKEMRNSLSGAGADLLRRLLEEE